MELYQYNPEQAEEDEFSEEGMMESSFGGGFDDDFGDFGIGDGDGDGIDDYGSGFSGFSD